MPDELAGDSGCLTEAHYFPIVIVEYCIVRAAAREFVGGAKAGAVKMKRSKKTDPLGFAADIIGLALTLYVLLAEGLYRLFQGGSLWFRRLAPEAIFPSALQWFFNLFILAGSLLPMYLVLRRGVQKAGLHIPDRTGKLPFWVLLPAFLLIRQIGNTKESPLNFSGFTLSRSCVWMSSIKT